ncbi:peptidase M20 [gut metagenome]|uniref:Peptidase M20 n=1 Tax=gut metagenome TaxID=749906 RepID=J9D4P5_9ZZZZ
MKNYDIPTLTSEAVSLLQSLIAIPSISREEEKAADFLQTYIEQQGMNTGRKGNNVWCLCPGFDLKKPTLLLNSHIDTVKPVNGWRKQPFTPSLGTNGKLYGLGSNDAGASVVSLLQTFLYLCRTQQTYNLIFLASCEEEVSGKGGIECILPELPPIDFRHCRRTYRNAASHCRKRIDGTGCNSHRTCRPCSPQRRRQCYI